MSKCGKHKMMTYEAQPSVLLSSYNFLTFTVILNTNADSWQHGNFLFYMLKKANAHMN